MSRKKRDPRSPMPVPEDAADGRAEAETQRPDRPDSWRDVLSTDYLYPEELDDLRGRERRRAKRTWRRDDHAQRMAWLRDQRRAEPTSPATVVIAVVLLAIIVLGLGGGLPRLLNGDEPANRDVGLLAPPDQRGGPDDLITPSAQGPSNSATSPSPELSTPPVLTGGPATPDISAAVGVATSWARTFYTRNPANESYTELVERTRRFISSELGESFVANGDSTYDALRTDGGKSTVASVVVALPRPESAPADTPSRISRLLTVTIDITGRRPDRIVLPLVVTLVPQGAEWVISDVNGSAGP